MRPQPDFLLFFRGLMKVLRVGVLVVATGSNTHAGDIFRGAEIYVEHCQDCHSVDGRGVPGVPDLTRGNRLLRPDPDLFSAISQGQGAMPSYEGVLRNEEILDVLSYLRTLR